MAEAIEGVQTLVKSNLGQPGPKPAVVLVVEHHREASKIVRNLEDRFTSAAVLFAENVTEAEYGSDRAEERIISFGQRNEMITFTKLIVLRFREREQNAGIEVTVEGSDVLPT